MNNVEGQDVGKIEVDGEHISLGMEDIVNNVKMKCWSNSEMQ